MAGGESTPSVDVPATIVAEFLKKLGEAQVPPETIERLRAALAPEKRLTDKSLKEALFPPQQTS